MTSIASFLANLTGAAPQEGQNATLANATGGIGLFAALLETPDVTQGVTDEIPLPLDTTGLPVIESTGQIVNDNTVEGTVLREALTNGLGLPQDGADIDAAIIEAPITHETTQDSPLQPAAQIEIESPIPQDAQSVEQPVEIEVPEATPIAAPIVQDQNTILEVRPRQQNQTPGDPSARPAGLENLLERAPQQGTETGLQAALNRTVQARGVGATGQPVASQGEKTSDASRNPAPGVTPAHGVTNDTPVVKTGQARPEFAPKAPEIVQRLINTGNGQSIIQIQERPAADNAGASSPPTLTVSVQAPAASPGPASANAPHVPVSALAVHIAQQASNGAKRFDIRLDPPELGRIEVRLNVSREGQVTTHLVVERAETLDLLQRDARQLERALQNAGLDMSDEDMKFSLKDQGLANGGDNQFNNEDDIGNQAATEGDDGLSLVPDDAMPPPTRYMAKSGLDIRI